MELIRERFRGVDYRRKPEPKLRGVLVKSGTSINFLTNLDLP